MFREVVVCFDRLPQSSEGSRVRCHDHAAACWGPRL